MKNSNTSKRLKQLMNVLNINQTDIVEKTGLPKSAISMYVNGVREPRQDKISIIADAFSLNEAWLMGYDVPMERKELSAKEGEKDAELIIKFSQLDEKDKKIVTDLIDSLNKKKGD